MESENKMNEQIFDSILFMKCLRESLCEIVEDSENGKDMVYFITNEASDYEVLSLIVEGKLPEEKYDYIKETELFDNIKDMLITENKHILKEMEVKDIRSLLETEILSTFGLDSRQNILEFMTENNLLEFEASDVKWKNVKAMLQYQYMKKVNQMKELKDKISKSTGDAKKALMQKLGYEKSILDKLKDKITNVGKDVGIVKKTPIDKIKDAGEKVASVAGKAAKNPYAQAGVGVVGAAALAYAAYKIYKNFLSKAARECKGAADKKECMRKYKIKGLQAQKSKLSGALGGCKDAKCKASLQKKIAGIDAKISKA